MRGVIEPRGDDRWRIRVYAGRENGKVRWVSRTVHGTKRQAQRALAKLMTEVGDGLVTAQRHPTTVSELLERWLSVVEKDRTPQTMQGYWRIAKVNIAPIIGEVRIDKLTGHQLDEFYRHLASRGLSPASVRRHHSLLHVALARAVKWGLIAHNPADRATPPGVRKAEVVTPSVERVQRLIAAAEGAKDPVLATAIAVAAVTGCRRGELCALRWSDIDWPRQELRVARSLSVIRGVASEGPTKTHQNRCLAIDPVLGAVLARRREEQERWASAVGRTLCRDPYLLSRSAHGELPCLPDGLSHAYKRLCTRLGMEGHFHELRHFAATTAIASGADVRTVAGRLGHADPSVTLRVYSHALEARDRDLAAVLGRAVLGAPDRLAAAK